MVTHGLYLQPMALPSPQCPSCFPGPRPGSHMHREASGGAPHCRLRTTAPRLLLAGGRVSSFVSLCRTEKTDTRWTGRGQEEKETQGEAGRVVPSPSSVLSLRSRGTDPVPTRRPCSACGTCTSAIRGPLSVYVEERGH